MLVLSVIALVMTLSIAPQCKAGPVVVDYHETPTSFTLTITGGAIDMNMNHPIAKGMGDWSVTGMIGEINGARDMLVINLTARHLTGPHPGEVLNVNAFPINRLFDAGLLPPGPTMRPIFGQIAHAQHFDLFQGTITITVLAGNQIGGYTIELTGQHVIPEPATLFLLGTGLTGIAMKLRKRRRNSKNIT